MKKIRIVLIGVGDRGTAYAMHGAAVCPEMEVVAVADPDPVRRNYIKDKFSLPDECCFEWGEDLLKKPKIKSLFPNLNIETFRENDACL